MLASLLLSVAGFGGCVRSAAALAPCTVRPENVAEVVVGGEVLVGGMFLFRGVFLQIVNDNAPFVDVSPGTSILSKTKVYSTTQGTLLIGYRFIASTLPESE